MAKDPATLWYWNDWHGGTFTMSRHLKGCYMDLLYAQFNNGALTLDEIKTVLGSDFGKAWPTLQKKFVKSDDELFFNERAQTEKSKRSNYSKSRRKNLKGGTHMESRMENVNEDVTVIDLKNKESFSKSLFSDEIWLEQLKMTHKGKDITQAWGECYAHHSADPLSAKFELWQWKQKLNTWLSIKKSDNSKKPSNKILHNLK